MLPITQKCRVSGHDFLIDKKDQFFYQKIGVPLPTLSPQERQRRRFVWRNERTLYHRKCDLCGKQIIAMYHPDLPYKVYCNPCFWSDQWNGLDYGRDFDFNRPFFEQIVELQRLVPRINLCNDSVSINCDYVNQTSHIKDSYLTFDSDSCEKTYYSHLAKHTVFCIDCLRVLHSQLCYECVDCTRCYNLFYSQDCEGCHDSYFLRNCKDCSNCFASANLRHKEYYYFNKQLTKEEYGQKMAEWKALPFFEQQKLQQKIHLFLTDFPVKENHNIRVENSSGDYLENVKDSADCFDCSDIQDCRYCTNMTEGSKDCYDYDVWGMHTELAYEAITVGENAFNVLFSVDSWDGVSDLRYCQLCLHSSFLFGCIGLKKNKYCILNKQYTKEEYEMLVPRIIKHMQKSGEWGEFFPSVISPFAYNETVAQAYFPLSKEQALARGYHWRDDDESNTYQGPVITIPDHIDAVSDDITKQILRCEVTGKLYKIIPQELAFYRQMGLPVPRRCPDQRHKDRLALRNPRKLWKRVCANCHVTIETTYAPECPEKIYCEMCYLREVY